MYKMVREIRIDYDPSVDSDSIKHDAWEKVTNKYHAMCIGSDRRGYEGKLTLLFSEDLDLVKLEGELEPIQILSFV